MARYTRTKARRSMGRKRTMRVGKRRTSMKTKSRWNRSNRKTSMKAKTTRSGYKKAKRRTVKRKNRTMTYKFSKYFRSASKSNRRTFSRRKAA